MNDDMNSDDMNTPVPPMPEHLLPRVGLRREKYDYIMGKLDAAGNLLATKPKALFESDSKGDKDLVNRKVKGKWGRLPTYRSKSNGHQD